MAETRGVGCAWKQANRAELANFWPEGRNRRTLSAAHRQEGHISWVIFNGLLIICLAIASEAYSRIRRPLWLSNGAFTKRPTCRSTGKSKIGLSFAAQ